MAITIDGTSDSVFVSSGIVTAQVDVPTTDSPTTDSPTTDSPTTDSPSTDLPSTGSDGLTILRWGLALLALGLVASLVSRRRRETQPA